jgi:predicted TIM-barrel fold metal-dependent hydrolase
MDTVIGLTRELHTASDKTGNDLSSVIDDVVFRRCHVELRFRIPGLMVQESRLTHSPHVAELLDHAGSHKSLDGERTERTARNQ